MKQKTNHHKEQFIIVTCIFVIVFLVLGFIYFEEKYSNTINKEKVVNTQQPQSYTSKILNIKINIPYGYKPEEKDNRLSIINRENKITLDKINTDFESLKDYLNDLEVKNGITINYREDMVIDGKKVIKAILETKNSSLLNEKVYFFHPDEWTVYSISTSSPELYDDLDEIAQSFRYTP